MSKLFFSTLSFVLLLAISANCQVITTIAGTGTAAFGGDGGQATAAQINTPYGVVGDNAGNVYFSDYGNNRIRKIDGATGIITTIGGTGTGYFSGDGGQATAAGLQKPRSMVLDNVGNLIFCDYGNNRVRKIDLTTGIITTITGSSSLGYSGDGGPATAATTNGVWGVAVDPAGNIYVADQGNNVVRMVNTSGVISTFAGTTYGYAGDGGPATAAKLNTPTGVACGGGNVYIADDGNNLIRKVNSSGIISTICGVYGIGTYALTGDNGPSTAAKVYYPENISCDALGNLFIADRNNNVVRKIDTSGIITRAAGNGYGAGSTVGAFSGDGGPATAASLNQNAAMSMVTAVSKLYIADNNNHRIRVVTYLHNPTFTAGDSQTIRVCHDAGYLVIDGYLSIYDVDAGQTETWSVVRTPSHGSVAGSYSMASTGSVITPSGLTYSPAAGFSGLDTFKIRVFDGTYADTTTIYVTVVAPTVVGPISGRDSICPGNTDTFANATPLGTWSVTNSSIGTISAIGVFHGLIPGIDTVLYTVLGCDTAISKYRVKVRSYAACHTGFGNPLPLSNGISVLRNPNNGTFTIIVSSTASESSEVILTDMKGKVVFQQKVATNQPVLLQTNLPPGVYVLTPRDRESNWNARIEIDQ